MSTCTSVAIIQGARVQAPGRGFRFPLLWALTAAATSVIFRSPGTSLFIGASLAGALTAITCVAMTNTVRTTVHWAGSLCCVTAVGAMAQIRLGESPARIVLILSVAVSAVVLVPFALRRLKRLDDAALVRLAVNCVFGCVVLRGVIPFALDPIDLLYFTTGTISVPGTGISAQIGEFTRPVFVIAVGAVLWHLAQVRAGLAAPILGRPTVWAVGVCSAAYLAMLGVVDNGPGVLTIVGLLVFISSGIGVRRSLREVRRWLASPVGVAVALAVTGAALAVAVTFGDLATRAPGRFLSLFDPNEQMRAGIQAMQRGGVIGSGMGTSPFALGVPVGESDLLPAVLASDLGMAVMAALGLAVTGILSAAVVRGLRCTGLRRVIAASIGAMLLLQTIWPLLANVGIAPLSGISAPFLVVSASSLIPAAISVSIVCWAVGTCSSTDDVREDTKWEQRAVTAVVLVRSLSTAALIAGVSILTLFISPVSGAAQIFMPRGDIRTLDGAVIATTNADGGREYPEGSMYVETGLLHPDGAQYAVEQAAADELTCGGHPSIQDRLFVVLRPMPCSPANVITTIDSILQQTAVDALAGLSGSVTVLDAATGKVRVLYSSEDIDPAEFRSKDLPPTPPIMHARQETATLGSVFKLITAAAGLIDGVDTSTAPQQVFSADGETLENFGQSTCPSTSLTDTIAHSCNTVAAFIGAEVGQNRLDAVAREYFAAGGPIPFDSGNYGISGLETGLHESKASTIELARTSIGQEGATGNVLALSVATAQLVHSVTQPGPDNPLPAPRLIEGFCRGGDFEPRSYDAGVGQPLPTDVANQILIGMDAAVDRGTATDLDAQGRSLAAKTGTADTPDAEFPVNSWITVAVDRQWVVSVNVHTVDATWAATEVANKILSRLPEGFAEPRC